MGLAAVGGVANLVGGDVPAGEGVGGFVADGDDCVNGKMIEHEVKEGPAKGQVADAGRAVSPGATGPEGMEGEGIP